MHIEFGEQNRIWVNGVLYVKNAVPKPLPGLEWHALEQAENRLYGANHGCNGWTHVMQNDGSQLLNGIWENVYMNMDGAGAFDDSQGRRYPNATINAMVAGRVARVFALMAFGPEILLA